MERPKLNITQERLTSRELQDRFWNQQRKFNRLHNINLAHGGFFNTGDGRRYFHNGVGMKRVKV